jgi:hypothetical protein
MTSMDFWCQGVRGQDQTYMYIVHSKERQFLINISTIHGPSTFNLHRCIGLGQKIVVALIFIYIFDSYVTVQNCSLNRGEDV